MYIQCLKSIVMFATETEHGFQKIAQITVGGTVIPHQFMNLSVFTTFYDPNFSIFA